MKPWSCLPNAALIDYILDDVQARTDAWDDALTQWQLYYNHSGRWVDETRFTVTQSLYSEIDSERWQVLDSSSDRFINAYIAIRDRAIANAVQDKVSHFHTVGWIFEMAWHAARVLIAYDTAGYFLTMPLDELKVLYALGENPIIALILPVAYALDSAPVNNPTQWRVK